MKRLSVTVVLVLFLLVSCKSGPLKDIRLGKTYMLGIPKKVAIHREPSYKAETFFLEETELFEVIDVVRPKEWTTGDTFDSVMLPLTLHRDAVKSAEVYEEMVRSGKTRSSDAFYKVKFKSGREGYIFSRYFYPDLSPAIISGAGAADERRRLETIHGANWLEGEKERVVNRDIWIGMTDDQFMLSLSPPESIVREVAKEGEVEYWRYGASTYSFKNGRLIRWTTKVKDSTNYLRSKQGNE